MPEAVPTLPLVLAIQALRERLPILPFAEKCKLRSLELNLAILRAQKSDAQRQLAEECQQTISRSQAKIIEVAKALDELRNICVAAQNGSRIAISRSKKLLATAGTYRQASWCRFAGTVPAQISL